MTGSEGIPPAAANGAAGGKKRKTGRNAAVVGGVALLLIVVGAAATPLAAGASVDLSANKDMASKYLSADAVKDLAFSVTSDKLDDVKLTWDGAPVEGVREGNTLVYRPANVGEGKHEFVASAKGRFGRSASESQSFELDNIAPIVTVDKQENVASEGPFTLTGSIEGAQAVKVDDKDVALDGGKFRVEYAKAPQAAKIWAQDAAGNVTEQTVSINGSSVPGVRAAHVTGHGWASDTLREPILQLIKDKKLDTVQLDIKDEEGIVGYDSQVPLAQQSEAARAIYDAKTATDEIHALGARVVGRIVAFRDPLMARWAVKNGKMDYVVQQPGGGAYNAGSYGAASFTNFGNEEMRKYNADLAVEAVGLGFDDIMWDYIRRPEGVLSKQIFPGIGEETPEEAIASFLAESTPRIHAAGGFVGAAVFGISSFTPFSVAQNIPMMAPNLDYINPMTYPSHWGPGEFGVASPNNQPYDIVNRSLKDFNRQVLGTDAMVIPWIQDFSLGVAYGVAEVRAQIQAAEDVGINSFVLWNAGARYRSAALEPRDAASDAPSEIVYSIGKPGSNSEGTTDAVKAKEYIDAYYAAKEAGTAFVPPGSEAPAAPSTETAPATGTTPADPATPAAHTATSAPEATTTRPTTAPTP